MDHILLQHPDASGDGGCCFNLSVGVEDLQCHLCLVHVPCCVIIVQFLDMAKKRDVETPCQKF